MAIKDDVRGAEAAKAFLMAGFDAFDGGEHRVLATAADANSGSSFTFWLDTVRLPAAPPSTLPSTPPLFASRAH